MIVSYRCPKERVIMYNRIMLYILLGHYPLELARRIIRRFRYNPIQAITILAVAICLHCQQPIRARQNSFRLPTDIGFSPLSTYFFYFSSFSTISFVSHRFLPIINHFSPFSTHYLWFLIAFYPLSLVSHRFLPFIFGFSPFSTHYQSSLTIIQLYTFPVCFHFLRSFPLLYFSLLP